MKAPVINWPPALWVCIKCEKSFDCGPFSKAMPVAFEIAINPKTGRQEQGGSICAKCFANQEVAQ